MIRTALTALFFVLAISCTGPKGEAGAKGEAGPTGPQGETGPGFMTPPSVSAVTPNRLAAGLTTDVSIAGFATNWSNGAQVSFGTGITVNSVKVGSRTGLVANITVAADAMPGTRDVKVTQGGEMTTFNGVFTILPLWEIKPIGMASRGGYWYFEIKSNDPDFAFPFAREDISVTLDPAPAMGELIGTVTSLKPRALVVRLHANFPVPLRMYTATVHFGADRLVLPTFDLAERSALMLSDATALMNVDMGAFESKLIQYTPAATPVPVVIHASGPKGARWQLIMLNDDGDPVQVDLSTGKPGPGNDFVLTDITTPTFFVLSEVEGKTGTQATVTAVANFPTVADTEPNDTRDTAQIFTLSALGGDNAVRVIGNSTGYGDDDDWYKVTATAADVGKRFHVRIYALDYIYYDTEVLLPSGTVFKSNSVNIKTVDFYTDPISAEGDYSFHLLGDYPGDSDIVISLQ